MGAMASQITAHDSLFNRLFMRRSKKLWKLRVSGLFVVNSPVTGEFPEQRARNAQKFPFDDVIMNNNNAGTECTSLLVYHKKYQGTQRAGAISPVCSQDIVRSKTWNALNCQCAVYDMSSRLYILFIVSKNVTIKVTFPLGNSLFRSLAYSFPMWNSIPRFLMCLMFFNNHVLFSMKYACYILNYIYAKLAFYVCMLSITCTLFIISCQTWLFSIYCACCLMTGIYGELIRTCLFTFIFLLFSSRKVAVPNLCFLLYKPTKTKSFLILSYMYVCTGPVLGS